MNHEGISEDKYGHQTGMNGIHHEVADPAPYSLCFPMIVVCTRGRGGSAALQGVGGCGPVRPAGQGGGVTGAEEAGRLTGRGGQGGGVAGRPWLTTKAPRGGQRVCRGRR
ncbi:unnamed protein product [Urochloa humidicola]